MPRVRAAAVEDPIAPELSIIDAHHHFWGDGHGGTKVFGRFLPEDFAADIIASGHRVAATVYVDCGWAFRDNGPEHLRCVGETEYVEAVARQFTASAGLVGQLGAGIVGRADLMLGDAVRPVLEEHIAASPTRFRGIRELLAYDPDVYQALNIPQGKSRDPRFRAGVRQLTALGLSLDALCVHTMLAEMLELARAFPHTRIILNHLAGPIGIGRFRGKREEVFADWRRSITALAECPNVFMKLSGFGAELMGFGWNEAETSPSSETLAAAFRPYILAAVEAFSPSRCMFASNFPVDGISFSYGALWNAFKRVASCYSPNEQDRLFQGTAAEVYRLSPKQPAG